MHVHGTAPITHLLRIHIDSREPATKARMGVIPTNNSLRPEKAPIALFLADTGLPVCRNISSIFCWKT